LGNNDANGYYLTRCAEEKTKPHPARFPVQLPEFFIKFLTGAGDLVLDPFAGSCTTGEAAERLGRRWIGFEPVPDYLDGARFRFERGDVEPASSSAVANANNSRAPHRQIAWL
jgi:site-specific DNA-methyltransferase (cytosine-N4-specific)